MADDDQLPGDGQTESSQPPGGDPNDPWIGQILGNYILIQRLGQGGMGVVYLARHENLDRLAAVKFLPAEMAANAAYVERFLREAKLAAKLRHSNIISVQDAGFVGENIYFFIMEYVEGRNLGSLLRELKVVSVPAAVDCIKQAAAALGYAHKKNIIHRDIKPENLMLTQAGVIKVGDLGLAKMIQTESDAGLTQPQVILGTAAYISPEQIRGSKDVDSRTDIYSLGATFFHLVTGKLPYEGQTPVVMLSKHLNSPVPEPHRANPHLDSDICAIIKKMMAKKTEDRFQTMEEVVAALNDYQSSKTHPPQPISELLSHVYETRRASSMQQTELGAQVSVPSKPLLSVRTGLTIAVSVMAGAVIGLFAMGIFKNSKAAKSEASASPHESVVTAPSIAQKAISEPTQSDGKPAEVVSLGKLPSQPPPLIDQKDSLIIAGFSPGSPPVNRLGGTCESWGSPRPRHGGMVTEVVVPDRGSHGPGSLNCIWRLEFDISIPGSSTGALMHLNNLDATEYQTLSFKARSETAHPIDFLVTLTGSERKSSLVHGIGRDWKTIEIPLADFDLQNLKSLYSLEFIFEVHTAFFAPKGVVFIDDIMLLKKGSQP